MRSLLLVDDDERTCEAVQRLLGRMGYVVVCASNGGDALTVLRDLRFDLVILDFMMPEMDGLEVLRRLREDARTRDVKVILYSAADDSDATAEAARLGASDCVLKSGGFFALYDRIEQLLPSDEGAPRVRQTKAAAAPGSRTS
jgi:two-component system alkaline phosphatase synthesis response regulator PhoP